MMKKCSIDGCERTHSCKGLCKHHYEKKRVSKNIVLEKKRRKLYYENNKHALLAKQAARIAANPNDKKLRDKIYYAENKEKLKELRKIKKVMIAASLAAWKAKNPGYNARWYIENKESQKILSKQWAVANKEKVNAKTAEHRAIKIMATTAWANHVAIGEYYALAAIKTKLTGEPWHVDHIVPLNSKIVCGLHTDYNLQVIRGVENAKKGNRIWPDMP